MAEAEQLVRLKSVAGSGQKKLPRGLGTELGHRNLQKQVLRKDKKRLTE